MTAESNLLKLRRSPLADRAAELAALTGGVALSELPFLSMISLRVDPASEVAGRVERALGLRLPVAGRVSPTVDGGFANGVDGGVAAGGLDVGRSVLWLGPDEFLVIGPDGAAADLIAILLDAVGDGPGSVVEVSANRDTVVLAGPDARNLLEKGCTLDLHPRSFTAGHCAQTTFARGHLLIWQTGAEDSPSGPVYRLLFRGSFADYFADWLLDAAAEFGAVA